MSTNIGIFWHGDVDYRESRPYLVQDVVPEVGHGLISGQWGIYKTFAALDLAHAVMSGEPFLGYDVMRRGGVLFMALEGTDEVAIRLQGVIGHRGRIKGRAPFAWIETCPPLIGKNAADEICKLVEPIAKQFDQRFGLPFVLIIVDTMIAGAGYNRDGQENDAAAGQAVMQTLKEVAKQMRCFVFGVDHFGKSIETGTRGTSAKESSADVVLAMLGDRGVSGEVTNTRLALRKRRGGANGEEHPFAVRKVEMGVDKFGKPMSTLVLDWGRPTEKPHPSDAKGQHWSKATRRLRQILMTIIADHGRDCQPYSAGPTVRACDLDLVRHEFYRQHPADGDEKQKTETRRQAFYRAAKVAQEANLIAIREINGVQLVWLTKRDEG
jgi:AAA domain